MLFLISNLITAAALVYGGIVDYKKREIPDAVHIIILVAGLINPIGWLDKILGLIIPAILLIISSKIAKRSTPGGDFKLLCSLGFNMGLVWLFLLTADALIIALAVGFIKKRSPRRQIPLCSYVAASYAVYLAAILIFGR